MKTPKFNEVNKSVLKIDALGLALGQAKFTDDFEKPGMIFAKLLRSPHAHARIKSINTAKAKAHPLETSGKKCWTDPCVRFSY